MAVVAEIDQNIQRIQKLVVRRTRLKATAFQRKTLLERRRLENVKRRGQETALEAPDLVRSSGGVNVLSSVASTGKSFFGRILQALAYLGAGWLLNNLPTIIGYGQEFIARLKRGREILSDMWSSIKGTFTALGKVFTTALDNLKNFDFLDSEKKMQKEVNNLVDQVNNVGKSFGESYELITKPFVDEQGLGTYSGQPIPQPGSGAAAAPAPTAAAPATQSPPPSESTGGVVSAQQVYQYLKSKGISHVHALGITANILGESDFRIAADETGDGSGGIGLFQYTFPSRKQAFLQAVPDYKTNWKGQIDFAITEGTAPQYFSIPFESAEAAAEWWMNNWERPAESVKAGRRNKHNNFIRNFDSQKAKVQPQTPRMPALPPTNTMAGQNYGDPRDRGTRRHAGQDYDPVDDANSKFYSRLGGTVIYAADAGGGYGNVVDIYNERLDKTERIAEGNRIHVKKGDVVQPGTLIQSGSEKTGVFHYEIRKGRAGHSGSFEGTINPVEFLKTITPERKGEQIIMVNRTEASAPTTTMYGKDSNVIIDSLSGLNSYIRKSMLARLADR